MSYRRNDPQGRYSLDLSLLAARGFCSLWLAKLLDFLRILLTTLAYLLAFQESLGMESRFISDAQISASSQYNHEHAAGEARLHYKAKHGGWSAAVNNQNQWLQVDLGAEISVKGIATQGRSKHGQWVTAYKLEYSIDRASFLYYKDPGCSADKVSITNDRGGAVILWLVTSSPVECTWSWFGPWPGTLCVSYWPSFFLRVYGPRQSRCP